MLEQALLPELATRHGMWALGPSFTGPALIKADADLIAAGLLLKVKTSQGDKRPDGTRGACCSYRGRIDEVGSSPGSGVAR